MSTKPLRTCEINCTNNKWINNICDLFGIFRYLPGTLLCPLFFFMSFLLLMTCFCLYFIVVCLFLFIQKCWNGAPSSSKVGILIQEKSRAQRFPKAIAVITDFAEGLSGMLSRGLTLFYDSHKYLRCYVFPAIFLFLLGLPLHI